jgi:23S rRNA (uracil1939-C5)-methyltransferase
VEEDRLSVSAMKANKQYRKADSMKIFTGKAEKLFPELIEKEPDAKTFVMMDPPRQGIAPQLADFFAGQDKIGAIAYLSCDLPTLARDLKKILAQGKYRLTEVVPFDMFPRTKHIEVAVMLYKN